MEELERQGKRIPEDVAVTGYVNSLYAVVTHFGDLGSLKQLPGLAIQRLMEKGYGFGGEGDWKTAAMGIEAVYIDGDTTIRNLQNELRWNSMYFSK